MGKKKLDYIRKGSGETVLFLHGLGMAAKNYQAGLDMIAEEFEVIAPTMYGINNLPNHPQTLDEYVELTDDFCKSISVKPKHVIGHSTGGAVGFLYASQKNDVESLIGVNPVLPVDYDAWEFFKRGLIAPKKQDATADSSEGVDEVSGDENDYGLKHVVNVTIPFFYNMLRKPHVTYKIVDNISNFDLADIKFKGRSLLLYGDDEKYFTLDETIEKELKKSLPRIKITKFKGYQHDWLMQKPDVFSGEVKDFLSQSGNYKGYKFWRK